MQIVYYDESGDDGYPKYSSPFFVLSALYVHYLNWQDTYQTIREFRRALKGACGLPIKMEMHTKQFLLNKNPYRAIGIPNTHRLLVLDLFCDLVANLDVRVINVVIVKPRIQYTGYNVLDTALTYSVQRIENDLDPTTDPRARCLIITDPGRVGKMRSTTRRIQRINYIPSKFSPQSYRREIRTLIEDPLPKDSKESYFVQLADLITFVVYQNAIRETGVESYSNRIAALVDDQRVEGWMDRLKPSLNLEASGSHPYGIVYHPK